MLFNSYSFLFFFLPATTLIYHLTAKAGNAAMPRIWLAAASLLFYAWWDPHYLWLIISSVTFNYLSGWIISRSPHQRRWLALAVTANLLLLGYYKYTGFLVANLPGESGLESFLGNIVLPIGISFFTFTQIAYLVDVRRGIAKHQDFFSYLLFVTFFPHLIAGPIIHYKDIGPQVARLRPLCAPLLASGLTLFAIGLFKKTVIADNLAKYANRTFDPAALEYLATADAWAGAIAYTYQLYFDFSGYSDMAIGLALMFGISFPINFNSPYKAESIIDFWRRWHMTLSGFLKDYLYIPLGGGHCGALRQYLNLAVVMLLGGLWHGAGWTFVLWGALHGSFLAANHAWQKSGLAEGLRRLFGPRLWKICAVTLTSICVMIGWIVFRAESPGQAMEILGLMFGIHSHGTAPTIKAVTWLGLLLVAAAVLILPNSQEIMRLSGNGPARAKWWAWQPGRSWAMATATMIIASLIAMQTPSPFLYFQF